MVERSLEIIYIDETRASAPPWEADTIQRKDAVAYINIRDRSGKVIQQLFGKSATESGDFYGILADLDTFIAFHLNEADLFFSRRRYDDPTNPEQITPGKVDRTELETRGAVIFEGGYIPTEDWDATFADMMREDTNPTAVK